MRPARTALAADHQAPSADGLAREEDHRDPSLVLQNFPATLDLQRNRRSGFRSLALRAFVPSCLRALAVGALALPLLMLALASCSRSDDQPAPKTSAIPTAATTTSADPAPPTTQAPTSRPGAADATVDPPPVVNDTQTTQPAASTTTTSLTTDSPHTAVSATPKETPPLAADTADPSDGPDPQPASADANAQDTDAIESDTDTADTEAPPAPGPPAAGSVEDWLDRIEKKHDGVKTLSARLKYDRNQLVLGDKQRHFGSLIYVKGPPPKFAIHLNRQVANGQGREQDHWYIFDGRYLVERINDRKQFIRRELMSADQAKGQNPLAIGDSPFVVPLPLRRKHLMDQFAVQIEDPKDTDPPNSIHFQLQPKPSSLKRRLKLWDNADRS